jgi:hypothetical protein
MDLLLPQLRTAGGRREQSIGVAESAAEAVKRTAVESHHFPELCFCLAGEAEIWRCAGVRQLKAGCSHDWLLREQAKGLLTQGCSPIQRVCPELEMYKLQGQTKVCVTV